MLTSQFLLARYSVHRFVAVFVRLSVAVVTRFTLSQMEDTSSTFAGVIALARIVAWTRAWAIHLYSRTLVLPVGLFVIYLLYCISD